MALTEIVKMFGERKVRSIWDDAAENWYFSVVDVVAVLTESADPRNYWKVLKNRLKKEGNQTVTNCNQLKLRAEDGKMRLTDVATAEQIFRLIQSIPSPKAEPFTIWMAKVAAERLNQLQDPELSIQQALADYRRLGYSEKWIARRLKSIDNSQGPDGRVESAWAAGRTGICDADECHLSRMGGHDGGRVQALQGTQEAESPRQHDEHGTDLKHAGGGINAADFIGDSSEDHTGSQPRREERRRCRQERASGDREEDGSLGHLAA